MLPLSSSDSIAYVTDAVTAFLFDISKDEKYIAVLRVGEQEGTITVHRPLLEESCCLRQHPFAMIRLPVSDYSQIPISMSPGEGEYVAAISKDSSWCSIYHQSGSLQQIECEGGGRHAEFLLSGHLVMVNARSVQLYNLRHDDSVRLLHKVDLSSLGGSPRQCKLLRHDLFVTISQSTMTRLWSFPDGRLQSAFCVQSAGQQMVLSPSGRYLAHQLDDAQIDLYEVQSGLRVNQFCPRSHGSKNNREVETLLAFEDDRYLLVASLLCPKMLQWEVWDVGTGALLDYKKAEISPALHLTVVSNARVLLTFSGLDTQAQIHQILVWDQDPEWCHLKPQVALPIPDESVSLYFEFYHDRAVSPGIACCFLDQQRVLRIGQYSVQLWLTRRSSGDVLLHKLLYIFCIPCFSSFPGARRLRWYQGTKLGTCGPYADFSRGSDRLSLYLDHDKHEIYVPYRRGHTCRWNVVQDICVSMPLIDRLCTLKLWQVRTAHDD